MFLRQNAEGEDFEENRGSKRRSALRLTLLLAVVGVISLGILLTLLNVQTSVVPPEPQPTPEASNHVYGRMNLRAVKATVEVATGSSNRLKIDDAPRQTTAASGSSQSSGVSSKAGHCITGAELADRRGKVKAVRTISSLSSDYF